MGNPIYKSARKHEVLSNEFNRMCAFSLQLKTTKHCGETLKKTLKNRKYTF